MGESYLDEGAGWQLMEVQPGGPAAQLAGKMTAGKLPRLVVRLQVPGGVAPVEIAQVDALPAGAHFV